MIPSVGRIVHYKLTASNAEHINRRRADTKAGAFASQQTGALLHVGNDVKVNEVYPMLITRLWTDNPDHHSVVQGQVFLDGNDNLWVTSVQQGEDAGQWYQPVHV